MSPAEPMATPKISSSTRAGTMPTSAAPMSAPTTVGANSASRRRTGVTRLERADETAEAPESLEPRVERLTLGRDAKHVDAGLAIPREPLADHRLRAEKVRLEHELVRHARRRVL